MKSCISNIEIGDILSLQRIITPGVFFSSRKLRTYFNCEVVGFLSTDIIAATNKPHRLALQSPHLVGLIDKKLLAKFKYFGIIYSSGYNFLKIKKNVQKSLHIQH